MRKCMGNKMEEWGFDAIFEIECPHCGQSENKGDENEYKIQVI